MIALLSLVTVVSWGMWIPVSQLLPGIPQRSRTLYASVGNVAFAGLALLAGGGHLAFGWRPFWLPLAGGVAWTAGTFCAFRATQAIGLARAAGTWTPLNIVVAFVWGVVLFGELRNFSGATFAVLAVALLLVLLGMFLIVMSQSARGAVTPRGGAGGGGAAPPSETALDPANSPVSGGLGTFGRGLVWAGAAGLLWGTYFVPAQWAKVPPQVGNVPLALGIIGAALALALPRRDPLRLKFRVSAVQLAAGVLFGVGNLALLGLVARVGTGVGFTIAQLSLLVNASIGIWYFKVPKPGSRTARIAMSGILVAGVGGCIIGTLR
ncbi:MAG: GRP family sugar transporter [Acidimicrobiales bacterium]